MPPLSRRARAITGPEGDAWALFHRTRALQAEGVALIDLTIGEHDIGTAPEILDAMDRAARGGATGYAPVPGLPALRDAVAARLSGLAGQRIGRENVMITPGGQAALFAAHHVAADAGTAGLIVDPYYATYPGTLRALDMTPVVVPTRAEAGFQPERDTIMEAARAHGARTLLINTPNNPTGAVYSEATLAGVAAAAREADLWVISDEVYDAQVWRGAHRSIAALPGMAERTLIVGSLSKSHAMTGSRLGWIAGPGAAIAELIELATHTTYGVPGYIQAAGLHALTLGAGLEAEIAAPFRARRDRVLAWLDTVTDVQAVAPDGAMYVMLDIRATGLTGTEFAFRLLNEARVAVMPGESFGQAAAGHLRLALTRPEAEIDAALDAIGTLAATCVAAARRAAS